VKRIVLLGGSGQVGYELSRSLSPVAELVSPGRHELDLSGPVNLIEDRLQQLSPDILINAAAYTAVDQAESEPEQAYLINAHAPDVMAKVCKALGIPIVHFSTDYVFSGDSSSAWREDDKPSPLNVYGLSKLQGEQAIQESGAAHLILRTSWVYGNGGQNFLSAMKRLAQDREKLNIVDDQLGAPTWARHLADAVSQIVAMSYQGDDDFWQHNSGVYHLTGGGRSSWYEFASAIFDFMRQADLKVPALSPIKSESYPTPARRPMFSVLDNSKIRNNFGIQLPDWKHSLKLVMQDADL
jgi:dTDP-4-dehydrorhamnose reductase